MSEYDEVEAFFHELADYIESTTVLKTYIAIGDEAKRKYIGRITITTCKAYAPKRNWNISMATVREFVGEVLANMEVVNNLNKNGTTHKVTMQKDGTTNDTKSGS